MRSDWISSAVIPESFSASSKAMWAPGGAVGEEAGGAAINQRGPVLGLHPQRRRGPDLAAEAVFDMIGGGNHARPGLAQGGGDLFGSMTDGRDDTQSGDDHTPHADFLT